MAERLTVSGATSQRDIDKLLELSNENQFGRNEAYYKLQRYEDLEEQGRLVILPEDEEKTQAMNEKLLELTSIAEEALKENCNNV